MFCSSIIQNLIYRAIYSPKCMMKTNVFIGIYQKLQFMKTSLSSAKCYIFGWSLYRNVTAVFALFNISQSLIYGVFLSTVV